MAIMSLAYAWQKFYEESALQNRLW